MDKKQVIIWTVVPNRVNREGNPRVSVVISPWLQPSDGIKSTVSSFPDFVSWPKTLQGIDFTIHIFDLDGKEQEPPLTPVIMTNRDYLQPNSDIWQALFPALLPVRGDNKKENVAGKTVMDYPTEEMANMAMTSYLTLMNRAVYFQNQRNRLFSKREDSIDYLNILESLQLKSSAFQTTVNENPLLRSILDIANQHTIAYNQSSSIREVAESFKDIVKNEGSTPRSNYDKFLLFHHNAHADTTTNGRNIAQEENNHLREFHKLVGILGKYRSLARAAGLVLDMVVPIKVEELISKMPKGGCIRVSPSWKQETTKDREDICPLTHFFVEKVSVLPGKYIFLAKPRSVKKEEFREEYRTEYGFLPLGRNDEISILTLNTDGAIPKLEQTGQRILQAQAKDKQAKEMKTEHRRYLDKLSHPEEMLPGALDNIGIAIVRKDLRCIVEKFFKHERKISDDYANGVQVELFAEDLMHGFHVDCCDEGQWRSLHIRRGRYVFNHLEGKKELIWESPAEEGLVEIGVSESSDGQQDVSRLSEALFRWEGWSLSARQEMEAIGGDGNVKKIDSDLLGFFGVRPDLYAVERTLPKLRFGKSYQFRMRVVDIAGNSWSVGEANALQKTGLVPEMVSKNVVYQRFNPVKAPVIYPMQRPGDGETTGVMVIRSWDEGKEEVRGWSVLPPDSTVPMWILHSCFDDVDPDSSYLFIRNHEGSLPNNFEEKALHDLRIGIFGHLRVPYLPDPAASCACISGLPGLDINTPMKIDFLVAQKGDDSQSSAKTFEIELAPGCEGTKVEEHRRKLIISLPAGKRRYIRLSTSITAEGKKGAVGTGDFAFLSHVENPFFKKLFGSGNNFISDQMLSKLCIVGQAPLITPDQEVMLIHASQRPISKPQANFRKEVIREQNNPTGLINVDVKCHIPSTGQLDVEGEWEEIDDNPDRERTMSTRREHAFSWEIEESPAMIRGLEPTPSQVTISGRHEFRDTKYRQISYRVVGTSRFLEFFPKSMRAESNKFVISSEPTEVHVLSSARPSPPEIAYIVPAFRWEEVTISEKSVRQIRHGGGLRIYLKRPWFSSGVGELLGIVLPSTSIGSIDEKDFTIFSEIGIDPLHASEPTPDRLILEHIPLAVKTATDLQLPCVEAVTTNPDKPVAPAGNRLMNVDVAGFKVDFDQDSNLAYCDIEIDSGRSYYPFVRLSLVRYQPMSIKGVELSKAVRSEFTQLPPTRELTVTCTGKRNFMVEVNGSLYDTSGHPKLAPTFDVTIEETDGIGSDMEGRIAHFRCGQNQCDDDHHDERLGASKWRWGWNVTLDEVQSGKHYRVVVLEFEQYEADSAPNEQGRRGFELADKPVPRLVYIGSVNIPTNWL